MSHKLQKPYKQLESSPLSAGVLTRILAVASLVAASTLVAGTASATQSPSTAAVTGNGLQLLDVAAPDFAVTLNGLNQLVPNTQSDPFTYSVQDATGTGDGWEVSVQETPYVSGTHQMGAGSDQSGSAPPAEVTLTAASSSCNPGCTPAVDSTPLPVTVPESAAAVVYDADPGSGMGLTTVAQTASLPVWADVFAGTYTSTWTVTLASGPGAGSQLDVVAGIPGESGTPDSIVPTASELNDPMSVATNTGGDLYVTDASNNVVEMIPQTSGTHFGQQMTAGDIYVIAGIPGPEGMPTPGPATSSQLPDPTGIAVSPGGNLYVADQGGCDVVEITPADALSVVAGKACGYPTPGVATKSDLFCPTGVALDSAGDLYIADEDNNVVEKVTPAGTLSVVAGVLYGGGNPTPGPATSSRLWYPSAVAVDPSGDLYIAGYDTVEEVTPSGTLSIVAGMNGKSGLPTPGPATSSWLGGEAPDLPPSYAVAPPYGLAVDLAGNLFIADTVNDVVEEVAPNGTLSVIAGIPGSKGLPTSSQLNNPSGLAIDSAGDIFIADGSNSAIEEMFGVG